MSRSWPAWYVIMIGTSARQNGLTKRLYPMIVDEDSSPPRGTTSRQVRGDKRTKE